MGGGVLMSEVSLYLPGLNTRAARQVRKDRVLFILSIDEGIPVQVNLM